jgi:pimeloyl-ACP methyl ester carboxylesterase
MRTMVPVGADEVWAEDSGGDGPPLVLLHPGIGDLRVWEPVWQQLTGTFRVIRYDFRGYGGSPQPTQDYAWLDDLRAVMAFFGLDSAHVVGNSQGGSVALALAVEHPQLVRSLVLLAPAVSGYAWPDDPETDARYEELTGAGDADGLEQFFLEVWCAAGHEPLVRDLVRSAIAAEPGEKQYLRELPDVVDRLGEVAVPAVLLVGDRDYPPLVAMDEAIAGALPQCTLVRLAGVDHLPSLRVPELVVETIRNHCQEKGSAHA